MSTADPAGARDHARAQGATRVESMPVLPPKADDLPPGAGPVLWEETIAAGGYTAKRLDRGAHLRLIDVYGDACGSTMIFNADQPAERLNVADTIKVQWNAYLGAGKLLLSDMSRVMMSIVADDAGMHDTFCGASNAAGNARKYGAGDNYTPFPSARDRFVNAVTKSGLERKDIHPCINFFKPVKIAEDGATMLDVGPFELGRTLLLRAEMNVLVMIANCPHVLDPRKDYTVTPLRVTAWRGEPAAEADPIRNSAPESLRAFLNTEDYYRR